MVIWSAAVGLVLVSCSSKTPSTGNSMSSFETSVADCKLQSSIAISGSNGTWNSCRVRFDSDSKVYTWQFLTPNTSGSWLSPGAGWITLSFNLDSPENASLATANIVSELPAQVDVNQVVLVYTTPTKTRAGGTGSIDVGSNFVSAGGSSLAATFHVQLASLGALTGSATATVAAAQSGGGGGSCTGDTSVCNTYVQQCQGGGQGPCYCAAACTCAASCDTTCQQQNHASASSVGFPCPY